MKPLASAPNLVERVYGAILDDILDGALVPGEHLVQEQLAANLGVSRQPIQQALALLKADGLIEDFGKRGLTVTRLDLARMKHHYEVRAVLDRYAARAAAARVQAGTITSRDVDARARPILEAGIAAVVAGSMRDQIHHDEALHKLIYELSGNPALGEAAEPSWRFLRRAMADVLRHAEPPREIWAQHQEIVAAVVAGEPDAAERLAHDHDSVAADTLATALAGRTSG